MLKLFRNIRRSLINEGNTNRYLKYAFGEIVLVVIGILIALQINNWNEVRKNHNEEKVILKSLQENLVLAKKHSELLILNEKQLKTSLLLVLNINYTSQNAEITIISDSIFNDALWNLESDLPILNIYNNLKFTNKLSLIRNLRLKEKFANFEADLKELDNMIEDRLNVQQIRIDAIVENDLNFVPLIKSNVPEINIENESKNDYSQILNNRRIRNLLSIKLTMTQDVIKYRETLNNEIKSLITAITSELKKLK
ncbi:DUF6090 family protein [Aestuariibaculum sediminum]|uniref:Uncharacterized protein n=1 Tax=Aestuariibaculum sediminum TaxID=2770637 RepID=A0A8J6Q2N9_9FLAO|nr:DUF6090 family protein [Aestuariibaculum sediminum]MBD0832414.1 hypothetical protein [Aestuariibaculum sediminum]